MWVLTVKEVKDLFSNFFGAGKPDGGLVLGFCTILLFSV